MRAPALRGRCLARPSGRSAAHRPARKGTAGCQNTPYMTYDPKGVLKKAGCNTAGDAYTALNEYMYWLLEQGAKHAKANGRKTCAPTSAPRDADSLQPWDTCLRRSGLRRRVVKEQPPKWIGFTSPRAAPVDLT